MTVKERIFEKINQLDDEGLHWLEQQLEKHPNHATSAATDTHEAHIQRQLELLEQLAEPLDDPAAWAEFDEVTRRRSLFGGRVLNLEPDTDHDIKHDTDQ